MRTSGARLLVSAVLLASALGGIVYEKSSTGCFNAAVPPHDADAHIDCPSGRPMSGWELTTGDCPAGEMMFNVSCLEDVFIDKCWHDWSACKDVRYAGELTNLVGDCTGGNSMIRIQLKPCNNGHTESLQYDGQCCRLYINNGNMVASTTILYTDCSSELGSGSTTEALSSFKNPISCPEGMTIDYMRLYTCSLGHRYKYQCRLHTVNPTSAPPTEIPSIAP
ncbi:hypothetical protein DIPPA_59144, partial [Diplonema papillatum]